MAARKFRVWGYDLWADTEGGWYVNNRFDMGVHALDPESPTFANDVASAADIRDGMIEVDNGIDGGETTYFVWAEAANSPQETYEGSPACEIEEIEGAGLAETLDLDPEYNELRRAILDSGVKA